MLNTIKKRFALSTQGAKDFCKGTFFTVLLDIALMLPGRFRIPVSRRLSLPGIYPISIRDTRYSLL